MTAPAGPRACSATSGSSRTGAAARSHQPDRNPAFVFPEMLNKDYVPATWVPQIVDYLSLAFWTATAFSPVGRQVGTRLE